MVLGIVMVYLYDPHLLPITVATENRNWISNATDWMNEWKCEDFKCVLKTDWEPALSNTLCKQIKPLTKAKFQSSFEQCSPVASTVPENMEETLMYRHVSGSVQSGWTGSLWRHQKANTDTRHTRAVATEQRKVCVTFYGTVTTVMKRQ